MPLDPSGELKRYSVQLSDEDAAQLKEVARRLGSSSLSVAIRHLARESKATDNRQSEKVA